MRIDVFYYKLSISRSVVSPASQVADDFVRLVGSAGSICSRYNILKDVIRKMHPEKCFVESTKHFSGCVAQFLNASVTFIIVN